jgi:hypothetical protein
MIRGTTPTLEFTLPFEVEYLADAYVTLAQEGTVVVEKCMTDCGCTGDCLTVRLTQEETLKFKCNRSVEIQIRAKTKTGDAIASDIITVSAEKILKDGVI